MCGGLLAGTVRAVRRLDNLLTRAPGCESLRAVHVDRDGGVRRADPSQAAGERRARALTHPRDSRRSDRTGAAGRAGCSRRHVEYGDRCSALSQQTDRRLAPRQGVSKVGISSRRAGYRAPNSESELVPAERRGECFASASSRGRACRPDCRVSRGAQARFEGARRVAFAGPGRRLLRPALLEARACLVGAEQTR